MSVFTSDKFSTPAEVEEEGAGLTIHDFASAISVYVVMNFEAGEREFSVADIALAFNATPELVREACDNPYLFWGPETETDPTKQFVEVDGE